MVEAVCESYDSPDIPADVWLSINRLTAQGPEAVIQFERKDLRNRRKLGIAKPLVSTLRRQRSRFAMRNGFHDEVMNFGVNDSTNGEISEESLGEIGDSSNVPHRAKIVDMLPLEVLDKLYGRNLFIAVGHITTGVMLVNYSSEYIKMKENGSVEKATGFTANELDEYKRYFANMLRGEKRSGDRPIRVVIVQ